MFYRSSWAQLVHRIVAVEFCFAVDGLNFALAEIDRSFAWMATEEDTDVFVVVMNHEEQYSIWLEYLPIPAGWHQDGHPGSKQACLEYVKAVWTDMRPLSLRRQMDAKQIAADTASE